MAKQAAILTFKIEKNKPLPAGARTRGIKYPFADMTVGDSFFVPKAPRSLRTVVSLYGKRTGTKFTVRKQTGGDRVWRIA